MSFPQTISISWSCRRGLHGRPRRRIRLCRICKAAGRFLHAVDMLLTRLSSGATEGGKLGGRCQFLRQVILSCCPMLKSGMLASRTASRRRFCAARAEVSRLRLATLGYGVSEAPASEQILSGGAFYHSGRGLFMERRKPLSSLTRKTALAGCCILTLGTNGRKSARFPAPLPFGQMAPPSIAAGKTVG